MFAKAEWPAPIQSAVQIADEILTNQEPKLREISLANHAKVLHAFQMERVSSYHLHGTTGYGLGDNGREVLDRVVARILGTEAALVRGQFVSGTHAIATALFGVLRPGDHLLSATGAPYDTLEQVIGISGTDNEGSLRDYGIDFSAVALDDYGHIQLPVVRQAITGKTRLLLVQRSRGYAWRDAVSVQEIARLVQFVHRHFPDVLIFVDNCYGELVEKQEPGDIGADLMAGSLIKNFGGGIAPCGGYIAGREDLVRRAAARLTAPGIGGDVGATLEWQRLLLQGLFYSPMTVGEALKGAIFAAALWQTLGFDVHPGPETGRTDLIQAIKLGSRERMIAFCQGLQQGSPVDAHVQPVPSGMPGYQDEVIMAGGTFIQGATSEFSADGPLRDPFIVYQQGGISYPYVRLGNILAAVKLWEKGYLPQ